VAPGSVADAVVEVNRAVPERALVQQFESQADVLGKSGLAAADYYGREKEVTFVDQARPESVGGADGPTDGQVLLR
jgi:hypothetical protein